MAKVDWTYWGTRYATEPLLTMQQIAVEAGCSLRAVTVQASKADWTDMRKKYIVSSQEKALEKSGDDAAERNLAHRKIWKDLEALANKAIYDIAKRNVEKGIAIDQKTIKDISQTLKIAIEGERVTHGLANSVTKTDITSKGRGLYEEIDDGELNARIRDIITASEVGALPTDAGEGTSPSS